MSQHVREQLQATLDSAHDLERELGGGGMSRVFVVEETALRRKVVVKLLSPELAQGISVERFEREILTAAALSRDFIEMWKRADPELQPRVAAARERLRQLAPVEGRRP